MGVVMTNLLSESEIISRVQGDWDKPAVTFLCATYNQEDYIKYTLDGFLKQKTSFPYEIVVHDDASTDGTKAIIESYRLRYPKIMTCIYQTENKFSQGINPFELLAKGCRSEYVALCEGDDYWINENKIENQYNLMMSDDTISMVVSPGKLERNGVILPELHCYYGPDIKSFTAQEILNTDGQFAPTASYLLKKEYLLQTKENFKKVPFGDLFIELYCAVRGKIVYYPEVGSVYRLAAKNSWSETLTKSKVEGRLKFTTLLETAIANSRDIKGFENLDWSVKLAAAYYAIANHYLKMGDFDNFKKAIKQSYTHSHASKRQKVLFTLKDAMFLIYKPSRPMLLGGRRVKYALERLKPKNK